MIGARLKRHPQDVPELREIALQIVTEPQLLLAGSSADYHWNLLAKALLPDHARAIARTIFAAQARPSEASFSLEYSAAKETLDACIAANATAVWEELAICLGQGPRSERFVIGFPDHVMELMPRQAVLDWIAQAPSRRAALIAQITAKNFTDSSLAAAILDRWGHLEGVKERFFSAFISGSWVGSAAARWANLATLMDAVAEQSGLDGVKRWARTSVRDLHQMAEHERRREVEEQVRRFN